MQEGGNGRRETGVCDIIDSCDPPRALAGAEF